MVRTLVLFYKYDVRTRAADPFIGSSIHEHVDLSINLESRICEDHAVVVRMVVHGISRISVGYEYPIPAATI